MRSLQTISLRELLPPSIASDPDILAAAEALDAELQKATARIPGVSILPNIREITDSAIIDLLAWQFHVDFYEPDAPLSVRRDLVAKSLEWHTRKGTPSVVEEVVTAALSDAQVQEWFEYGGAPYFFRISTHLPLSEETEVRRLLAAIDSVKNTRSWLEFIEAISTAWQRLRWGSGIALLDTITVNLRSPDSPPFVDAQLAPTEVYANAYPVWRGHIVTLAEEPALSVAYIGLYEMVNGTIVTKKGVNQMAQFRRSTLTIKGLEILSATQSGRDITFTRMEVGDGLPVSDPAAMTSLRHSVRSYGIEGYTNNGTDFSAWTTIGSEGKRAGLLPARARAVCRRPRVSGRPRQRRSVCRERGRSGNGRPRLHRVRAARERTVRRGVALGDAHGRRQYPRRSRS